MPDEIMIEVECPVCGRKIKRPLSRLRRRPQLQCPTCYRTVVPSLELWTRDLTPRAGDDAGEEE